MNTDETTVVETETQPEVTADEVTIDERVSVSADPLDAITDLDELRKAAKAQRAIAQRYKKPSPLKITNKVEQKSYNILEDEVADLILSGHTKDETKFILANGGRKALEDKNSYVSIAINAKREQRKTEEAVSQTSNKAFVAGGKTYSEADLKNMTPEEMMKVLPQA